MARDRLTLAGYWVVLLPPAVFVGGVQYAVPAAAFLLFVAASPLTRFVFGVYQPRSLPIGETMATALHWLPAVHLAALTTALLGTASIIGDTESKGMLWWLGTGLSLWTVMVFGIFPAHEMLHRQSRSWIRWGSIGAGLCGYPFWGHEHALHHLGVSADSEWPKVTESAWTFAVRRGPQAVQLALSREWSMRQTAGWPLFSTPVAIGTLAMLAGAGSFLALAGPGGFALYLACCAGVGVSVQIMTYVQHWGLGLDSIAAGRQPELAWEDDCLMQAWLTLNNSFHLAHHRSPSTPFYFLEPCAESPRQPGCYVAMLVLCMWPATWRRVMLPVLDSFKANEQRVCAPGRRAICITPSRLLPRSEARQTPRN